MAPFIMMIQYITKQKKESSTFWHKRIFLLAKKGFWLNKSIFILLLIYIKRSPKIFG